MTTTLACDLRLDRAAVPADRMTRAYARLSLKAPPAPAGCVRPPVAAALVLDRSGSMEGEKLAQAKEAASQVLRLLEPRDRFALVVYDDAVEVVVPLAPATPEAVASALARLAAVTAGSSTNLAEGWLRGCEQAARAVAEGFVGRCLLLTDGLANSGLTDPATLQAHASGLRARGVVTSAFGVGEDFDERFLQGLSAAGGGHFYFIEAAASIPVVVGREMGEVLEVVLHQASVEVETRRCLVDPIAPLGLRVEGTKVHLDLGDLVSGQEMEVLFALRCTPREGDPDAWLSARVVAREGAATPALERRVARARDAASASPRVDPEVAVPVAAAWAARARLEALPLNQRGHTDAALAVLAKYAHRIRAEFPAVPDALLHAQALERETAAYAHPMPAMDLKRRHFASSNVLSSRSPEGFSRRS